MPTPEQQAASNFRECLMTLAAPTQPLDTTAISELTSRFRSALLLFGSESDDNRDCAAKIEVGMILNKFSPPRIGVRLRGSTKSVTNVLWHAEGCPIPLQLVESFPELSQQQWDACLRLATLVFSAFEAKLDAPDTYLASDELPSNP